MGYALPTVLLLIVGLAVAAFVFRAIVIPACIYIVQYARYGRVKAEDDALDAMGENKMSYVMKGESVQTPPSPPNPHRVRLWSASFC